jgi:hypothetical protein
MALNGNARPDSPQKANAAIRRQQIVRLRIAGASRTSRSTGPAAPEAPRFSLPDSLLVRDRQAFSPGSSDSASQFAGLIVVLSRQRIDGEAQLGVPPMFTDAATADLSTLR